MKNNPNSLREAYAIGHERDQLLGFRSVELPSIMTPTSSLHAQTPTWFSEAPKGVTADDEGTIKSQSLAASKHVDIDT